MLCKCISTPYCWINLIDWLILVVTSIPARREFNFLSIVSVRPLPVPPCIVWRPHTAITLRVAGTATTRERRPADNSPALSRAPCMSVYLSVQGRSKHSRSTSLYINVLNWLIQWLIVCFHFRLLDEVNCTLETDLVVTGRNNTVLVDNGLQSPHISPLVTHLWRDRL